MNQRLLESFLSRHNCSANSKLGGLGLGGLVFESEYPSVNTNFDTIGLTFVNLLFLYHQLKLVNLLFLGLGSPSPMDSPWMDGGTCEQQRSRSFATLKSQRFFNSKVEGDGSWTKIWYHGWSTYPHVRYPP